MDPDHKQPDLPSYEDNHTPSYQEEIPPYDASTGTVQPHGPPLSIRTTVTLDPTGLFIKKLPSDDSPPLYTLSESLLHVHGKSSVHVKRQDPNGGEGSSLAVYAIGEHFISPLVHTRNRMLRSVTAARSHGFLVTVGIREIVWDFSTRVPLKKEERDASNGVYQYPTDPVYMIGTSGMGAGTVQKHLLQANRGKWVDDDDEIVALEREGGAECEGMPVLSVMKDLDTEMTDFLISAWCVTMWGDVGKRARHHNKTGGHKN